MAALSGVGERLRGGDIGVTSLKEFYGMTPGSDIVDPETGVATCVAAVEKAIEDGYSGFRAVVDATAMVRQHEQRDGFARYEFLIDQKMGILPFSSLCGYDITQLTDAADGLRCLHPHVSQGRPSFRLHADPDAAFALSGYIDPASDGLFTTTLQRIWWSVVDDPLIIDAQGLEFISHQQLYTLDHHARTDGRTVILRIAQRIPTRLAGLLDLTNVAVEPPPNSRGQRRRRAHAPDR